MQLVPFSGGGYVPEYVSGDEGVLTTLIVNVCVFTALVALFLLVKDRKRWEFVYTPQAGRRPKFRESLKEVRTKPERQFISGVWRWVPFVWNYPDEQLFSVYGIDSWIYVQFLKFSVLVFGFVVFVAMTILMPANMTGSSHQGGFNSTCINNIDLEDRNIYAHVVGMYLITAFILYVGYLHFDRYLAHYWSYRRQPLLHNYSCYVRDTEGLSSSRDLYERVSAALPPGELYAASMAVDVGLLAAETAFRRELDEKLYRCQWTLSNTGVRKRKKLTDLHLRPDLPPIQYLFFSENASPDAAYAHQEPGYVDSILWYEAYIRCVDSHIQELKHAIELYQSRRFLLDPTEPSLQDQIKHEHSGMHLPLLRADPPFDLQDRSSSQGFFLYTASQAVRKLRLALKSPLSYFSLQPPLHYAFDDLSSPPLRSLQKYIDSIDYEPTNGFLTFNTPWNLQIFLLAYRKMPPMLRWRTHARQIESDLEWDNLQISKTERWSRDVCLLSSFFLLLFFWVEPIGWIIQLLDVQNLKNVWLLSNLISYLNDHSPLLINFITKFTPSLCILLFMNLLVPISRLVLKFVGRMSTKTQQDIAVFNTLYTFFLFLNLLFIPIELWKFRTYVSEFLQSPLQSFLDSAAYLGKTWPTYAAFYVNYIMNSAVINSTLYLCALVPICLYSLRRLTCRTPRDLLSTRLSCNGEFEYDCQYARHLNIFTVALTYCSLSPLTSVATLFYFLLWYLVDKFSILYRHDKSSDSAGQWAPLIFKRIYLALFLYHFALLGTLILKRAYWTTLLMLPMFFLDFSIYIYLLPKMLKRASRWSLEDPYPLQPTASQCGLDKRGYVHPLLKKNP
ncbi:uncharacterized protein LOC126318678 [Schistocerca gregaria]|uniref:uncharacterized protein LOC126318678 n=1 Tax=Schistocerca gregaria TaxID=7010 RepID=UPI00211DAEB6|nr:uncharacterized protein LOC126318678 [Schistocerca gregaria]